MRVVRTLVTFAADLYTCMRHGWAVLFSGLVCCVTGCDSDCICHFGLLVFCTSAGSRSRALYPLSLAFAPATFRSFVARWGSLLLHRHGFR